MFQKPLWENRDDDFGYGDGYDEYGRPIPITEAPDWRRPAEADPLLNDPQWGWRRKSWLDRKKESRSGYRHAMEHENIHSYDYGFKSKATGSELSAYDDYQKTGVWHGYEYYKKSSVDYRYIEQMANILSAQHNIKVEAGMNWSIDIKKKLLMYNPTSLMFGTKADVLASLLHEIGHLRHTTHPDGLVKGQYLAQYGKPAFEVLNCFEDFRIDDIMRKSYAGSEGIYEANTALATEVATGYLEKSKIIENTIQRVIDQMYTHFNYLYSERHDLKGGDAKRWFLGHYSSSTHKKMGEIFDRVSPMNLKEMEAEMDRMAKAMHDEPNLSDYLLSMVTVAYGIPLTAGNPKALEMVDKTKKFLPKIRTAKSTQAVLDILEKSVYPVIEPLLKAWKEGKKSVISELGEVQAEYLSERNNENYSSKKDGEIETRVNRGGRGKTPQEWYDGNYDALRESVDSAIKELIRKLQIIKTDDEVLRWDTNLKRGRVNTKSLYRFASGRYDFFKKRKMQKERTRNFVFSLMVDVSGSMKGVRSINSCRGTIILAEVFSHFQIPFEIVTFGSTANTLKSFDSTLGREIKDKVGGIVESNSGGTNMEAGLYRSKLNEREEKAKYMVVLTDGDVSDPHSVKQAITYSEKKGVKHIGIDLSGGGGSLKRLIENTREVEDPYKLPGEFEGILKEVIRQAKKG